MFLKIKYFRSIFSAAFSVLLLLFALPLLPEAKRCANLSGSEQESCWKGQYQKMDRALNALYGKLRAKLNGVWQKELKENSVNWIRLKESICERESSAANRWQCLYEQTADLALFLEKAFSTKSAAKEKLWPGQYEDGLGGSLEIKQTGNHHTFSLTVVRGPTSHIGEVSGIILVLQDSASFSEKDACGDETCCRLDFSKSPGLIRITEENCDHLKGARAYFAGAYYSLH